MVEILTVIFSLVNVFFENDLILAEPFFIKGKMNYPEDKPIKFREGLWGDKKLVSGKVYYRDGFVFSGLFRDDRFREEVHRGTLIYPENYPIKSETGTWFPPPESSEVFCFGNLLSKDVKREDNTSSPVWNDFNGLISGSVEGKKKGVDARSLVPMLMKMVTHGSSLRNQLIDILSSSFGRALVQESQCPAYRSRVLMKLLPPCQLENLSLYPLKIELDDVDGLIRVRVAFLQLKQKPVKTLTQLGQALRQSANREIDVCYYGDSGIDDGGLAKDLVYQLCQALSKSPEIALTDGVPKARDERECKKMQDLGELISLSFSYGGDLPLGELIAPQQYLALLAFEQEELLGSFETLSPVRLFVIASHTGLLSSAFEGVRELEEQLQKYCHWDGGDVNRSEMEDFVNDYYNKIILDPRPEGLKAYELKESIFAHFEEVSKMTDNLRALHAIGQALARTQDWTNIQAIGADQIRILVQGTSMDGVIDRESLKRKVAVSEEICHILDYQTYCYWIIEWIDSASEEDLKAFLADCTGAAVEPTDFITIRRAFGNKSVTHSCYNYLDLLPKMSKEDLFAFMASCSSGKRERFLIA